VASLRLVAHGLTPALRHAVFGGDDDLDEGGRRAALILAGRPGRPPPLGHPDVVYSSPVRAAVQTCLVAGHQPVLEPALADCDYGTWNDQTLTGIATEHPHAVHLWLTNPEATPHGGESLTALIARVGAWLERHAPAREEILAFTHAAVIRAAHIHTLGAPPQAFWQVDVAPLSVTHLRTRAGRWTLNLTACRERQV
jgi:broad specificity phosphatase PhoE